MSGPRLWSVASLEMKRLRAVTPFATILWLIALRREGACRGLAILKLGLVVMPPVLLTLSLVSP
jgi:hypothetical protein